MSSSLCEPIPPRVIDLQKPVRVVLVGGFLGAGKTTAIGALASELSGRGLRVAIVTNDQAPELVDTIVGERLGYPVAEVAGGCFCCRFEDMLDAIVKVLPSGPDVVLCEPVGSCTDMAATVLNPLKVFYPRSFSLAPFTVLADPARVRQFVSRERPDLFGPEVGYIFRKQLEESDAVALTKCDKADADDVTHLAGVLEARYGRPVLRTSAIRGDGIREWASYLLSEEPSGGHVLGDLDYDAYARGEAELGWLNATAALASAGGFDGQRFIADLLERLRAACDDAGGQIAHVKAALDGGGPFARGHVTATEGPAVCHPEGPVPVTSAHLILNARVAIEPERLQGLAMGALQQAAEAAGLAAKIETVRCFSPSYPNPPYVIRGAR